VQPVGHGLRLLSAEVVKTRIEVVRPSGRRLAVADEHDVTHR
jgi:hypothetical protein